MIINNIEINDIIDMIKIFLISYFTEYFAMVMINCKIGSKKTRILKNIYILAISILYIIIRNKLNFLYSTMLTLIMMSVLIMKYTRNSFTFSLFLITISFAINYAVFIIAGIIMYFVKYIFRLRGDVIVLLILLNIYVILIYNFSKIKKFRRGFTFLQNDLTKDYISMSNLNISTIIIIAIVMLRDSAKADITKKVIFLFLIIIVMVITIKKSFELYYKQKLLIKDLDETKEELAKTKEELAKAEKENLEASKRSHSLVHRQKALEFQISELRKSKNSKDINKIKQDVENLSKELYGKEVMTQLSKTNIELIDNMFRYMQFECYKNEIRFDLQICGNIYKMINNVINKETLEILLADHIKNAIIAVKHSENSNKSILVKLGKIGDCYGVCIYDSGIEFKEETFKTLGKKPSSTHLDEGGSGMGFLNTFDTLNKYKASLIIDEIGMPCEENYTKVIMIKFDGKNEFKVNSYRQQKAV